MKLILALCLLVNNLLNSEAIFNVYPRKEAKANGLHYSEPLFLTPYIERGDIVGGQKASLVKPLYNNIISYSGFFTVNKAFNSNIFFWFFPAEIQNDTAPIVVWLQGGPGASSLFGLFEENGPFYIDQNYKLVKRDYYWTKTMNVIYIDNPAGTGFSFTDNEQGYAKDQIDVGKNLYITIQQFLTLFPQYRDNEFYVTGESYAGKYVPALAYTIHEFNKIENEKINLKGLAIGDGLCDPATMLNYADYLYQIGLIDINTKAEMKRLQDIALELIHLEKYALATEIFSTVILGDSIVNGETLFTNKTGFDYYYNFLHYKDDNINGDVSKYLNQDTIRNSIHVGNLTYNSGHKVEEYLKADIMRSVKPWVQVLLENYRVIIYSGQLDIIVAYPLTLNFLQSLNWSGAEEYKTAERKQWFVNNELAGFTKTVGKFTEVLVRNAGHMVPSDQPLWAYDLVTRLTKNIPF